MGEYGNVLFKNRSIGCFMTKCIKLRNEPKNKNHYAKINGKY